jgi:hypothetical protein
MKGKKWSTEEKLALIEEAEKEGVVSTCRKYGISLTSISSSIMKKESIPEMVTGLHRDFLGNIKTRKKK